MKQRLIELLNQVTAIESHRTTNTTTNWMYINRFTHDRLPYEKRTRIGVVPWLRALFHTLAAESDIFTLNGV